MSGIVLPVDIKFASVSKDRGTPASYLEHLAVPRVGRGSILSSPSSTDSSGGSILSLTDGLVKEGLIGCYNFLNGQITTVPDSKEYMELNLAVEKGLDTNAH